MAVRRKRKGRPIGRPLFVKRGKRLDGAYVLCLPALGALYDVELDALAFLKAAEALCLDGGVMDEYVLAVFTAQKAEALCVVKPLNGALFHDEFPFFRVTYRERNVEVIAMLSGYSEQARTSKSNSTI
jgi:hypothetical protein